MNPLRAIGLKLGSVTVFVVMASLIKATAAHVPAGQAVFFRSALALPVIVGWLALRRELRDRVLAPVIRWAMSGAASSGRWRWASALPGWASCR